MRYTTVHKPAAGSSKSSAVGIWRRVRKRLIRRFFCCAMMKADKISVSIAKNGMNVQITGSQRLQAVKQH
jgi:hypothetical protein